jgi:hypothetical protein
VIVPEGGMGDQEAAASDASQNADADAPGGDDDYDAGDDNADEGNDPNLTAEREPDVPSDPDAQ